MDATYNDIQQWNFKDLVAVFGADPKKSKTYQVRTKQEAENLFKDKDFSSAPYLQVWYPHSSRILPSTNQYSLSNCICLKRTLRKRSRGLRKLLLRLMQSNKPPRPQVNQLEDYHNACMTLTMMMLWFTGFIARDPTLKNILQICVIDPVARVWLIVFTIQ